MNTSYSFTWDYGFPVTTVSLSYYIIPHPLVHYIVCLNTNGSATFTRYIITLGQQGRKIVHSSTRTYESGALPSTNPTIAHTQPLRDRNNIRQPAVTQKQVGYSRDTVQTFSNCAIIQ